MIVSEYSNGFTISLRSRVALSDSVAYQKSKRGNVTSFSSKSSSRLRHLLMRLDLSGKIAFAVTLTIPGYLSPDDWRRLVERFRMRMLRLNLGLVWRVELQRRGVPHLHCVLVCDSVHDVYDVWNAWVCSADTVFEGLVPCQSGFLCVPWSCHRGFLYYGFSCRRILNVGWFGYVAAHAVKHKSNQLGWLGRQWGVINRSALSFSDSVSATVDDSFLVFLCRCIRKRFRFSKIRITNKGSYDFFVSPNFMASCKSWFYRDLPF